MAKKKAPAGGISKMDAVRQAMAALGNAATRTEIQKVVKERFGVEMNLDVVSSYKSFVAKESKKSTPTTPAAKPVATKPPVVPTTPAQAVATTAVVIATPTAKPVASKPMAAMKQGKKPQRGKTASKPMATVAPAPSVKATGIALNDVWMVKELVQSVGVNALKTLIDLLS